MLSNHKIQVALEEIKEISRTDLALYDDKGKQIAATFEPEPEICMAIGNFMDSMAESQMLSGCHFFKVVVENEVEYVLIAQSASEEAYMIGRLAVCQIRNIVLSYREQFDRNNFMQKHPAWKHARGGHVQQGAEAAYRAGAPDGLCDRGRGKNDSVIMETVKGLFSDKNKDFVTEVDEQNIILVKDATELGSEEEAENIARMIVDTLHAEAMVRVRVGYGTAVDKLQDIPKSYQEAKMALEVGNIFYVESETISYARLGIGRLIYQLPMSLCEMFIAEIFGERKLDLDDETLVTIQKFFENNLNISETARQLYVHRNTLVYRLERLQKMIGLDIRKFEDAMTFKIAMMVIAHMTYQTGGLEE